MEGLEDAFDADRALVFGIGGGGDVVGAIPTARLLERHGVEAMVGGLAWERSAIDPRPGPRSFDEVENVERVSDAVGLATGETRTRDGVEFAETRVARHWGEPVALVDATGGSAGVAAGLEAARDALGIDLVVGTDSGGDALAAGDEPGLRSPLADAICVSALDALDPPATLGVFGYGSDGELTTGELDRRLARVAAEGGLLGAWGLTPRTVAELAELVEVVPTEASRLPVEAARGATGEHAIREGSRTVELTPASTVTFYVDPGVVAAASALPGLAAGTDSFEAAHRALADAGYTTEYDLERDRQRDLERDRE